ncbi:MAG: polysaccharide deacetylase family protein [Armatimonadota bacterium]|nr:polysaccharide deacetylase family protein [Armatimonadota bacterium]
MVFARRRGAILLMDRIRVLCAIVRFSVVISLAALLTAGLAVTGAYGGTDRYVELLTQAVDQIDNGQYSPAMDTLDQALTFEPGDITGRLALAVALAHTRKVDLAIEEYKDVLAADPKNGMAAYGLGVCLLSKGQIDEASGLFGRAASQNDRRSAAASACVDYLRGRAPTDGVGTQEPAMRFVEAASLRRRGRLDEAQPILIELSAVRPSGYEKERGAVMTLDSAKPIEFTGEAISRLPRMRVSTKKGLTRAWGEVMLRPDAAFTAGAEYLTIQIDGALAAMINSRPFQYAWETIRFGNGIHTVTMSAQTGDGVTLNEKTRRYWVENRKPAKERQPARPAISSLTETLWRITEVRPSLKLSCYYAGKYYLSKDDLLAATPYFEKAAACDPDYLDVRALLQKCYGRSGYKKISGAPNAGKVVAITFDDGPNGSTKNVLEALDREGVKATFFMVGSQVEANPGIVKTISDHGHEVESHTFSHRNLEQLSEREVERELLRCAVAIREATGKESLMFRPPGGHLTPAGEAAAAKYGFTGVFWTHLCSSFETRTPELMTQYVTTSVHDGAIVLMHNGDEVTTKALPEIISELKAQGYTFVTLSELIGRR